MKDLKRQLKRQAKDVLPGAQVKERIRSELAPELTTEAAPVTQGNTLVRRRIAIGSAAALCLAILILLAALLPLLRTPASPSPSLEENKFTQITDADSFYAYGAASLGTLIASAPQSAGIAAVSAREVSAQEETVELINRYLTLVEGLLSDQAIEERAIAADHGYEYGMSVTCPDLLGSANSYTLYYDRIASDRQDADEESYAIEGILLLGGVQYPVMGNYEAESDREETESELYFLVYTDRERNSYLEVRREYETEENETETEYVYSRYENGSCTERTEIEYESEDGEQELQLTIRSGRSLHRLLFEEGTRDNERALLVTGELDGTAVDFYILIRQGSYHYVFSDGSFRDESRYDDDDERERGRTRSF